MCHRTTCRTCGKPTWAGCGQHVEQALAGVPKAQRCTCREQRAQAKANAPAGDRSWWSKLFSN